MMSGKSVSFARRGCACITLEMLRLAVEELQMKRCNVTSDMIEEYLLKNYPMQRDARTRKLGLKVKLDHAVSLGILTRFDKDTYCLSTFRQEAYNHKSDLTSFWERHYKKRPGRRIKPIPRPKKKSTENISSDDSNDEYSDSSDDCPQ